MLATLQTKIRTAQAAVRGSLGREGSVLDTARTVTTTLRTNGPRGLRRWLNWQGRLGDTPRRGGRADAAGPEAAALDTFAVRSMADVPACFARLQERAGREDQYAFDGATRIVVNGYCLVCGWGDAVGEPVGSRWGLHRYRVPSLSGVPATRSVEGSAAVFMIGSAAAIIGFASSGHASVHAVMIGIACGLAGALVEAISNHGIDNFTTQVVAAAVAQLLT